MNPTPGVALPATRADTELPPPTNPWRLLRRQQDRRRYLRILTPPRSSKEKPRRPSPVAGVPRSTHHLLASPAAMTRTATNFPHPEQVRQYLRHSADITMRGGLASALVYPLAVCGLAEHYVFRRIGGTSAGAVAAATTAAAELGRAAADPTVADPGTADRAVPAGFAGLAVITGWLAGQDLAGQDSTSISSDDESQPATDGTPTDWPEAHRLARMIQPSEGTHALFRAAVALLRQPHLESGQRAVPLLAATLAAVGAVPRLAVISLWLGGLIGWAGFTVAFVQTASSWPLALVAALALLATVVLIGIAGTVAAYVISIRSLLQQRSESENYGLVPGTATTGTASSGGEGRHGRRAPGGLSQRLDRLVGIPERDGAPALVDWLTDRLDDLAGLPHPDADPAAAAGDERRVLTFGDLWLGHTDERTDTDLSRLRRAADDHEHRVIDLALVTTDLSQGRPYTLPFVSADRAVRDGSSTFLFCQTCQAGVLPGRVVRHLLAASPAQAVEATCPRHPGSVLHELPDPWDLPVVFAVRLAMATPGLMRAVPLQTLDQEYPGAQYDTWGAQVTTAPAPAGVYVPRTHWFCDGAVTSDTPVHLFDTRLPRWPSFGLQLDHVPTSPVAQDDRLLAEWLSVPEQDAAHRPRPWRRLSGLAGYAQALVETSMGWRDGMRADLPGYRGRVALVRRGPGEDRHAWMLPQPTVLALALRGLHAGLQLRERFTGPDGEVPGQNQTDRYRWIRLRMALREYRALSLEIAARLPLYSDLAATYRVPSALSTWFTPPLLPGHIDPAWPEAAATVTHLRALSAGGVLDWDTDYGAPPIDPDLRLTAFE